MSTNSPDRANYMTHKRDTRDSTINKFQNLSQKSPLINSPNLNEETYQDRYNKEMNNHDLKLKLETLLKNNSQLLNENAILSEMVNTLRMELDVRIRREEDEVSKANHELNSAIAEMKSHQASHQHELQKLFSEISKLHDQNHELEKTKSEELRRAQEGHEREMVHQISQIKKASNEGRDLMDLQIKKLKELIEMKQFEYESLKNQLSSDLDHSKSESSLLKAEIDHLKKLNQIQLNQIARKSKEQLRTVMKHLELEKNVENKQFENKISKLKKELASKDVEIEQVAKKSSGENEEIYLELSSIKREKQYLIEELQSVSESSQQRIVREKERLAQLALQEKQNLENLFLNERESLNGEKQKLMQLCIEKSEQIRRLYDNMSLMRETANGQKKQLTSLVESLRKRLSEIEGGNLEEIELLKIKMGQLHQADLRNFQSYYENQVAVLLLDLKTLRELQSQDRQKIYHLLTDNDDLRKNFEVEISKQKAKIQDMKVKFAAARLEFKEQITSLGTKMELTSQTLVRETEQKQKGAEFFEAEKRKFYNIISNKDKQIQNIHQTMTRLKQINEEEITQQKSQINMLRDALITKENQFKDFKNNLEQEFERKSMRIIEETSKISPDEEILKQNHELKGKITDLEKDNFKKTKEIEFILRENKSLQQELGLRAGFLETMQLESSAAIEDQKTKIKVLMGKNEVAMKDYYESKLASREQDNEALKQQLQVKESDLREIISKYNHLEKKMKELMDAQAKLSSFEEKIVSLGLDQNLVKNMADLFSRHKKKPT